MNGHYISIGYNYDQSKSGYKSAWRDTVDMAVKLQKQYGAVRAEVERVENTRPDLDHVEAYLSSGFDVKEKPYPGMLHPEDFEPYIALTTSGVGPERKIKEQIARAFIRLLFEWAHANGINLQLSVS